MKTYEVTSIRQQYKDMTRERILDAAIDLMAEAGMAPLTVADVASRAGVTTRTIYRHFETREGLIEAVWPRMQSRVRSRGFPRTADEIIATPAYLFPQFDQHANLVRASAFSDAGLEVRLRANEERTTAAQACVTDALPDLPADVARRRAAVIQLLDSAYCWAVLRDFWGFDGVAAGRAASEAIAILLGRAAPESVPPETQGELP